MASIEERQAKIEQISQAANSPCQPRQRVVRTARPQTLRIANAEVQRTRIRAVNPANSRRQRQRARRAIEIGKAR